MRILLLLVLLAAVMRGADSAPLPAIPDEVTLANGKVIKNVSVVRYQPGGVMLKFSGGVAPFRFEHIGETDRPIFIAHSKANSRQRARAGTDPAKMARFHGQVFIQTRGDGAYKFGAAKVRVFSIEDLSLFDSRFDIHTPPPILTAITDAEGRFTFEVQDDKEFFIFCQAYRRRAFVGAGDSLHETYQWLIPSSEITDPSAVMLTARNARPVQKVLVGEL